MVRNYDDRRLSPDGTAEHCPGRQLWVPVIDSIKPNRGDCARVAATGFGLFIDHLSGLTTWAIIRHSDRANHNHLSAQ